MDHRLLWLAKGRLDSRLLRRAICGYHTHRHRTNICRRLLPRTPLARSLLVRIRQYTQLLRRRRQQPTQGLSESSAQLQTHIIGLLIRTQTPYIQSRTPTHRRRLCRTYGHTSSQHWRRSSHHEAVQRWRRTYRENQTQFHLHNGIPTPIQICERFGCWQTCQARRSHWLCG